MYKVRWICSLVVLITPYLSCRSQTDQTQTRPPYNNCYVMAPVRGNSDRDDMREDISAEKPGNIPSYLHQIEAGRPPTDSNMIFMTNFRRQKKIVLSQECAGKLNHPDSIFIAEIYASYFLRPNSSFGDVEYITSYEKNILNFGPAVVYEYDITAPVSQAPKHVYLILPKAHDDPDGIPGLAFCNDEIKWYKAPRDQKDILSVINWVSGEKKYEIIMNYSDGRFVPVGHSKIGNW